MSITIRSETDGVTIEVIVDPNLLPPELHDLTVEFLQTPTDVLANLYFGAILMGPLFPVFVQNLTDKLADASKDAASLVGQLVSGETDEDSVLSEYANKLRGIPPPSSDGHSTILSINSISSSLKAHRLSFIRSDCGPFCLPHSKSLAVLL